MIARLLAFMAITLFAAFHVLAEQRFAKCHPLAIVPLYSMGLALLTSPLLWLQRKEVGAMLSANWKSVLLLTLIGVIAEYVYFAAYQHGIRAVEYATFTTSMPIIAAILTVLLFGSVWPHPMQWIGIVVVAIGIMIFVRT